MAEIWIFIVIWKTTIGAILWGQENTSNKFKEVFKKFSETIESTSLPNSWIFNSLDNIEDEIGEKNKHNENLSLKITQKSWTLNVRSNVTTLCQLYFPLNYA
jgi:hypothetical protein